VLVFVGEGTPVEVVLEGPELARLRNEARQAAHDLLAVGATADAAGLR
jgi:hypothetical protein